MSKDTVSIGLSAAIVAVEGEHPSVLVVAHEGSQDALPFGPFDPSDHRTLESGLRKWVGEQTKFDLGYTEQLYTFGDKGRHTPAGGDKGRHLSAGSGDRVVSVGYLALTRQVREAPDTQWRGWYHYFPWEDWRDTKPAMIDSVILPALKKFVKDAADSESAELRRERVNVCFGEGWDEERVLERYELLYEAGLVEESIRAGENKKAQAPVWEPHAVRPSPHPGNGDCALRGKLKYRPWCLADGTHFTLLELRRAEAAGSPAQTEFPPPGGGQGLVEGTGKFSASPGPSCRTVPLSPGGVRAAGAGCGSVPAGRPTRRPEALEGHASLICVRL
jgi:hypothetical protein